MAERDASNLDPSSSPASFQPSSQSPPPNQNGSGLETSTPLPLTPPENYNSGPPPVSTRANITSTSQLPPPLDNSTHSLSDEPHNVSVTVQAIPAQASKHSLEPAVPPPSRGAVIAFGALTAFFVTLTLGLLLWRRLQNRRAQLTDNLSEMEKNQEPSSGPPSRSTSSSQKPLTHLSPKVHPKPGPAIPNPFARRGINRPSRPASLPLDSRITKAERTQKAQSQELKPHTRPNSWRSSIASVWESLGLPSRVLHDPNSHFWSDSASVNSQRSTRNLVSRPSAITEEVSMRTSSESDTTLSDLQPTRPQSCAPSRETIASVKTLEASSLNHHKSPSASSTHLSQQQPPSENLMTSGLQDNKVISPSPHQADSQTTSNESSCQKSPTDPIPVKNISNQPMIPPDNVQVVPQNTPPSPIGAGSLDSHTTTSDDLSSKSSAKKIPTLSVIALENTPQVTQTIPI